MKTPIVNSSIDCLTDAGYAAATIAPRNSVLILTRGMTLFSDVPVCVAGNDVAFNQDVKVLLPSAGVDPLYLACYLQSKKQTLLSLVDSAGHGTGRLDTEALANLVVVIPSLPEQRRIAGILATWDAAIAKTERLAVQKQAQRDWLSRALIGRPSASGEWSARPLAAIARPVIRKNTRGATHVLTSSARLGLVDQRVYFNKDVSGVDLSGYYLLRRGEFAYNRSTSGGYPFGAIKRLDRYDEGVLSTLYLCFALDDVAVSSDFLCHLFESGIVNRELGQICQAGARSHGLLNVTKSDFFGLPIPLPPRKTQDEITVILDAADREIHVAEELVHAYRRQKQGLSDRLLSGDGSRR